MLSSDLPFFSIVIPTFNRPQFLGYCLAAIAQLTYPRDRFEVIVVDDGGTATLAPVLAQVQEQLTLTHLQQPTNTGPATARNRGAAQAQGDWIAFTDDDCAPAPSWLMAFAQQISHAPNALLGGQTLNALLEDPYAMANQALTNFLYAYCNADPHQAEFFTSNNMALPAALFLAIGGFDTTFPLAAGEDRDLCDRWRHEGYSLRYIPEAQVYHSHPLTLPTFWRQHFNYGQGAYHFHRLRAQRRTGAIQLQPSVFYLKLLCYPLQRQSSQSRLVMTVLFLLTQVANSAGFFWQKLRAVPAGKTNG